MSHFLWINRTVAGIGVLALLIASDIVFAQDTPAEPGSAVFDAAQARIRDAETLKSLSAEGQLLYQRERVKLDGYQYCSQAVAQAERGDLRESIRSASKALHLGQTQGNEDLIAVSKRDMAIAYSYAGDLDRAEQYATEALRHQARNPPIVLGPAYKILGDVAARRGKLDDAIGFYTKAYESASDKFRPLVQLSLANTHIAKGDAQRGRELYDAMGVPAGALAPLYRRGLGNLLLAEGKAAQARAAFETAAAESSGTDSAYHRLWAIEGMARSELALGNKAAARTHFMDAAAQSESIRAKFRSEEFKTGLFGDVQKIFEQAIDLSAQAGNQESAWQLSERSRARALLDIVRGRATAVGADSAVALADIVGALRKGETLVQFHSLEDRLLAWTITSQGLRGHTLPTRRSDLDAAVEALRHSIFNRGKDSAGQAAALYDKLIAPLALPEGGRIIVVPHGGLHYLPFQALRGPQGYLIERHAIAIVPSASVAVQLASPGADSRKRLVAFGNPANGAREDLPGAEREVQHIGDLFPEKQVYFQREASKTRFREMAGAGRILHVAAHAEVDSVDPLNSRILLAAEETDPGFLEAREVYGVNMKGVSLVTLSACESGLGRIARGDEIQGFTRSFLSAGTSGLVASLWPVADDSTELLMTTFYGDLAKGVEAIDAMRHAQLAVLAKKRFSHPFFWAPFNLIGDWRLRVGT